jgi:hypothetical protein
MMAGRPLAIHGHLHVLEKATMKKKLIWQNPSPQIFNLGRRYIFHLQSSVIVVKAAAPP